MYVCIVKFMYRKCDLQWVEATVHKMHTHAVRVEKVRYNISILKINWILILVGE